MRGFRSAGRFVTRMAWWPGRTGRGARRRRFGLLRRAAVVALAMALPPMLMGAASSSGHAPTPTAAGIHDAVVRLADWVTGKTPAPPKLPKQLAGTVPGNQRQVPAAVTRAVARAQGRAPGKGPGQLPAYTAPAAAREKPHVTGPAGRGGADSFHSATSTLMPSGATPTSKLYRNGDGSYTRLEYPVAGSGTGAVPGTLEFSGPSAGAGVKGTHVTSAALQVLEIWTGTCPALATVDVSDASGQRVGHWAGKPPASACGDGATGSWISVPISAAGLRTLNSQPGAKLTATATPAPASGAGEATTAPPSGAPAVTPSAGETAPAATSPASGVPAVTPSPGETAPAATSAASGTPAVTPSAGETGQTAVSPATGAPAVTPSPGETAPAATSPATGDTASAPVAAGASASPGSGAVLLLTAAGNTPPQLDDQWPTNGYNSPTLTPELIANGSDADGDPLGYDFTIYDAKGTTVTDSGWLPTDDWYVPAGTLAWGQTYYWTVLAGDGIDASSDPPVFALRTPVPQPQVYMGMGQDGGHGFDQQNGNFTTQATDASIPAAGPALSVQRTYNSLDALTSDAFGTGWSSVLDMTVSPGQLASDGSVVTQLVSYPDGERVAFGKNADGKTWSPPQGRYATFTAFQGGWRLDDKNDTLYQFTHALGGGRFGLDLIADAWGHVLQFTWTGGQITKITSNASHRSLSLAWSTPSGASNPHVAAVTTPDVTLGQDSTAITWQYSYSGDELTAVCNASQSGQPCTRYDYKNGTNYPAVVLDSGPQSYWRLNETAGNTAASSVLTNEGTDNATYVSVAQGIQPSPLAGVPDSVKAAGFDGTSSFVQVPASLADDAAAMSVSLWFNTTATGGVLASESADPVTSATTTGEFRPLLYIGSSGQLHGGFAASGDPMQSTAAYNDGNWHNVVLTSTGGQQAMYVDGNQVATKPGTVSPFIQPYFYLGAGFLGGSFPDQPHTGQSPAVATYFYGAMSDAATWARPLTATEVSNLYISGRYDAGLLQTVTRPSGKNFEQATYDDLTSAVTQVTDPNGGSWDVHAPTVTGSSRVYVAAVQGARPIDYWRLGDVDTTTAVNQFVAGTATYSNVTQGEAGGPFSDMTVDRFNGTSSYLALPDGLIDAGNESVSLWFKTTATDGILLSSSADPVESATTSHAFTPNIYIGDDGNLLGEFDYGDAPIGSDAPVNDGKWHNVVLAAGTNDAGADEQALYLDGKPLGTVTEPIGGGAGDGQVHDYVGAGFLGQDWPDQPHPPTDPAGYPAYFTGDIAEVAVYGHGLTQADVTHEWVAAQHSPGLTPVETATVTDPGNHLLATTYDPGNSARVLSSTDGLGNTTSYGYDAAGFQERVTDPNGHVTDTGYDVRGNMVSQTTCQDQAAAKCETSYYAYLPDDTTPYLDPTIPANDAVKEVRDPRSSSMTDDTYKTTNEYNQAGYLVKTTTPPVPGHPSGRTTTYDYTDGTTTAGSGDSQGRIAPGGLRWRTTSPNVAVTQTLYDYDGNVVKTTNPDGLVTTYTYDNIGRKLSQTVHVGGNTGDLTTTYAYDANGHITQQTSPPVTDRIDSSIQHTAQVKTSYDLDGNVLSQVTADTTGGDASRTVSSTYNSHDQLDSSTDAAQAVTRYTYDDYGNKASQTDALGDETDYTYDPNGHLLTTTLLNYTGSPRGSQPAADKRLESRAYDPAGRLASVTDAMGRKTSYGYTDNGLTATVTRTGPSGISYKLEDDTYDAAGNLTSTTANNGATTTNYDVDAAGRVASQTVDPGGLDQVTAYSYDPDDHVATQQVSQGSGSPLQSLSYTYDPMGNKTSQTVDDPRAGGPAGWWALDQASGTSVPDSSGTGNLATASAGVTWAGGAAVLPGTDGQRIATRGPVLDTTGSFTVSAWVKLAGSTGSNQIAVSQDAGQLSGFYLGLDSDTGTWRFVRPDADSADTSTFYGADSGLTAQTGVWTFLAGVFDANTGDMRMYAYVNNTAHSGTASDLTPIAANGPLEIGASKFAGQAGTNAFKGSIADVQVYPAALTPDEVSFLNGQTRTGGDFSRDALVTTWNLDPRGLPTSQTNPDRVTTYYDHDEAGRLAATSGPPVAAQTWGDPPVVTRSSTATAYDTFGDAVATQDPNGNVTTYEYDADGRQTAMTLPEYDSPDGSGPVNGRSTTQYNALGQVTKQTDPLLHDTLFEYDQLGNRTRQTNPDGGVIDTAYDEDGEQLSVTGPNPGAQTSATWDDLGRQVTATSVERFPSSAAYTTVTSYAPTAANPSGTWKSSVTSPDNDVTASYGYDAAGETTQVTDGAGNTTHFGFDALGRQTATVNPDNTKQTVTYDPAGNQVAQASISATGQTLATQTAAFDGEGDQVSATDPLGNSTTFTRDSAGTLTAETQPVTNASGIITSFGYDAAGNQTRYTDGLGNDRLTVYNTWNLPEIQTEPGTSQYLDSDWDNRHSTIAYNGNGDPVTVTGPGGVTVTDSYDPMGDLSGQTGSGATAATADRSFTYDKAGNLLTAATTSTPTSGATSETFTWNDRGLPLTATGSAGSTSYTWNGDAQQVSVNDVAGTTGYTYDSAGRLKTLTDPASGATLTYSYNPMSQVGQVSYGTSADTRTYTYDDLHQLKSDTLTNGSTTVASIGYTYDLDGNLKTKNTTNFGGAGTQSNTYGYDQASRLTSWNSGSTTTAYAYDGAGNRIQVGSTIYHFDARDELTSDGTSTYSYTANGNLSSVSGPSGTVNSTSDAYGQQAASGTQSSTYDANNRVVGVTAGSSTTPLSYVGATGQIAGDGTAKYSWTPDGTLIGTATTPGAGKLNITDRHTDVVAQFTPAATTFPASRTFGPWGTVTTTNGSFVGTLGYQSQYTSPATGQTNMGSRWYNPATGSFGNKDTVSNNPVPDSASASPYGYAADDPLDATDPTGHCSGLLGCLDSAGNAIVSIGESGIQGATSLASQLGNAGGNLLGPLGKVVGTASGFYIGLNLGVINGILNLVGTTTTPKTTPKPVTEPTKPTAPAPTNPKEPTPPPTNHPTPPLPPLQPAPKNPTQPTTPPDTRPVPPPDTDPAPEPGPVGPQSPPPDSSPDPGLHTTCGDLPEGAVSSGGGWIKNTTQEVPQRNKFTTPNHKSTRASTATACLTKQFVTGSDTGGIDITGYEDARAFARSKGMIPGDFLARCHLISREVGGLGEENNLVPCWQRGTNIRPRIGSTQDSMRQWEIQVRNALSGLGAGDAVIYVVRPRYKDATSTIPNEISMTATILNADGTVRPLFTNRVVTNTLPGNTLNLGN